jgi:hypothetical protein
MRPISDGGQAYIDGNYRLYKTGDKYFREDFREEWWSNLDRNIKDDSSGHSKDAAWEQMLDEIDADERFHGLAEIDQIERQHADQFAFAVVMLVIGVCIGAGSVVLGRGV